MALELKLGVKLSQQLVMTPQLQQAIRLLQLSRLELAEEIRQEMVENPVLEEVLESEKERTPGDLEPPKKEKETAEAKATETPTAEAPETPEPQEKEDKFEEATGFEWEQYLGTYTPGVGGGIRSQDDELPSYEATLTKNSTLTDHMIWQLRMSDLSKEEQAIAMLLIGSLDDNGYLQDSIEDIAAREGLDLEFCESVLRKVQEFDPIGVCARDLKECLQLQIRHLYGEDDQLERIVTDHMHNLERKNYQAIAKDMGMSLEEVYESVRIISELEPKPGRPFVGESTHYITPDIYVYKIGGDFVIVLNDDGLPKLKISSFYQSTLKNGAKGATKEYIQDKLKKAIWLIKSIQQRQRTIFRVTESIVKFQRDFFEKGIAHLKPMVLRDVAEDIGMHESTISRVTSNKYVHCPQGIYELKFFFNSGINRMSGDALASEAVKNKIKKLIADEDPKKPLSDQRIVELLREQNIDIARRTVAKYREMLGILSSSKRKRLL